MSEEAANSPSRKKRKFVAEADSTTDEATENLRKSLKFWFDDGNIVIKTSDTLFRVHRSVLSLHSSVFKDMFALAQPESSASEPAVEGCPIVPVTDSSEDWDVILALLYNTGSVYRSSQRSHLTTRAMFAMLRLGHKYDIQRFKSEALEQIKTVFPTTLPKWDDSRRKSHDLGVMGHEFEALRLLEDLQIQSALPIAYYACIKDNSLKNIMDDHVWLTHEMKTKLVLGKERIMTATPAQNFSWLWTVRVSNTCTSKRNCQDIVNVTLPVYLLSQEGLTGLHSLGPFNPSKSVFGLCVSCSEAATDSMEEGRQALFQQLPSFFDLPKWDDLKDF